jgi:sugar lactone lactonase YvrE
MALSEWVFDRHVSAAGWLDRDTLLIASETDLIRFDIDTGAREHLLPLEADNAVTRSNDGRADPFGGFWIGTMGKQRGGSGRCALSLLPWGGCEAARWASLSLTRPALHAGWEPRLFRGYGRARRRAHLAGCRGLAGRSCGRSGSIIAIAGSTPMVLSSMPHGRFWCAEWGGARVACYDPDGKFIEEIALDVPQPTCPAFGGAELSTLFVTTARQGLPDDQMDGAPRSGMTLSFGVSARGQFEHRVIL